MTGNNTAGKTGPTVQASHRKYARICRWRHFWALAALWLKVSGAVHVSTNAIRFTAKGNPQNKWKRGLGTTGELNVSDDELDFFFLWPHSPSRSRYFARFDQALSFIAEFYEECRLRARGQLFPSNFTASESQHNVHNASTYHWIFSNRIRLRWRQP